MLSDDNITGPDSSLGIDPPSGTAARTTEEIETELVLNQRIKADCFHIQKRYSEGCASKTDPLFAKFASMLKTAFFVVNSEDMEHCQMQLRAMRGMSDSDISKLRRNYYDNKVRRTIPLPSELVSRLNLVIELFRDIKMSDGILFFKSSMASIHAEQLRHVMAGCLSDPPGFQMYYDVSPSPDGMRQLRTPRGTNSNESFHLYLNKILGSFNTSPELAEAVMRSFVARWNAKAASINNGMPYDGFYAPELLDQLQLAHVIAFGTVPYSQHLTTPYFTPDEIEQHAAGFGADGSSILLPLSSSVPVSEPDIESPGDATELAEHVDALLSLGEGVDLPFSGAELDMFFSSGRPTTVQCGISTARVRSGRSLPLPNGIDGDVPIGRISSDEEVDLVGSLLRPCMNASFTGINFPLLEVMYNSAVMKRRIMDPGCKMKLSQRKCVKLCIIYIMHV